MLTGSVTGSNRAALQKESHAIAAAYYGVECVSVDLWDETTESAVRTHSGELRYTIFAASFAARVHHDIESKSYGPDRCRGCGKDSWPHSPLPQRKPDLPMPEGRRTQ